MSRGPQEGQDIAVVGRDPPSFRIRVLRRPESSSFNVGTHLRSPDPHLQIGQKPHPLPSYTSVSFRWDSSSEQMQTPALLGKIRIPRRNTGMPLRPEQRQSHDRVVKVVEDGKRLAPAQQQEQCCVAYCHQKASERGLCPAHRNRVRGLSIVKRK
jgi:hypothetical protein